MTFPVTAEKDHSHYSHCQLLFLSSYITAPNDRQTFHHVTLSHDPTYYSILQRSEVIMLKCHEGIWEDGNVPFPFGQK